MSPVDDDHEELVLIGIVKKAHGIRGMVKILPYSGEPENFLHYKRLLLDVYEDAAPVEYTIEQAKVQKDWLLVQLKGCTTRDAAEELIRAEVYVWIDDLPEPGPGEFYLHELEGLEMRTQEGVLIGQITAILPGSQDIACVKKDDKEHLIPLVPEFIVAIEEDAVIVTLPPGLLEIND